ncbi:MAG: rod-binding protein, partial [Rhodoferax sp.]
MSFGAISNSQALAADAQSLGGLKMEAGKNSPQAIQEAAKQFESLFMRELLKSMREATVKSGMLDSPGGDLGTDLLDQQFAVQMSGQPGGLSDLIAQQLKRQMGTPPADAAKTDTAAPAKTDIAAPAKATTVRPAVSKTARAPTES